ncbi:hypothetical protein C7G41_19220 [Bradyrhizobium sp. MOS002]|nr:hypothetical protein C7G41_19220 [Bradyrhizobium sp. MOS002]
MPSKEGVPVSISADEVSTSSLRAQRSNPESFRGGSLDCFVARAPRNDGVERPALAMTERKAALYPRITSQSQVLRAPCPRPICRSVAARAHC